MKAGDLVRDVNYGRVYTIRSIDGDSVWLHAPSGAVVCLPLNRVEPVIVRCTNVNRAEHAVSLEVS